MKVKGRLGSGLSVLETVDNSVILKPVHLGQYYFFLFHQYVNMSEFDDHYRQPKLPLLDRD